MYIIKLIASSRSLLKVGVSKNKAHKLLIPKMVEIQMALKTELGIFEVDSYHNPSKITRLRDEIEKIQENG